MICPWCDTEYPIEFFEEHHLNHIHEDDRPENKIMICVKCHKRHHKESGYDTVILKKNDVTPKTLEEMMVQIDREVFLKVYREHQEDAFKNNIDRDQEGKLKEWIENNGKTLFCGQRYMGFGWKGNQEEK